MKHRYYFLALLGIATCVSMSAAAQMEKGPSTQDLAQNEEALNKLIDKHLKKSGTKKIQLEIKNLLKDPDFKTLSPAAQTKIVTVLLPAHIQNIAPKAIHAKAIAKALKEAEAAVKSSPQVGKTPTEPSVQPKSSAPKDDEGTVSVSPDPKSIKREVAPQVVKAPAKPTSATVAPAAVTPPPAAKPAVATLTVSGASTSGASLPTATPPVLPTLPPLVKHDASKAELVPQKIKSNDELKRGLWDNIKLFARQALSKTRGKPQPEQLDAVSTDVKDHLIKKIESYKNLKDPQNQEQKREVINGCREMGELTNMMGMLVQYKYLTQNHVIEVGNAAAESAVILMPAYREAVKPINQQAELSQARVADHSVHVQAIHQAAADHLVTVEAAHGATHPTEIKAIKDLHGEIQKTLSNPQADHTEIKNHVTQIDHVNSTHVANLPTGPLRDHLMDQHNQLKTALEHHAKLVEHHVTNHAPNLPTP